MKKPACLARVRDLLCLVLVGSILPTGTPAAWTAFSRSADSIPAITAQGVRESFTIEISVPGIDLADSEGYVKVVLPDHAHMLGKNDPELPVLSTSIMLPESGAPRVSLEVVEEHQVAIEGKKVLPSRGRVTRDIPLSSIPLVEGDTYTKDAFFPAETYPVEVGTPYILRDVRGASVRIAPVLYNPAKGLLRVLTKAKLTIEVEAGALSLNQKQNEVQPGLAEFMPLYQSLFVNFDQHNFAGGAPDEAAGHSVIIAADKFVGAVAPLQSWREEKGIDSRIVPMSEVGAAASDIATWIAAEYAKGGLTHILLVGDGDTVPTLKGENESADCDNCFVKLEGDDHIPDALISRFSAKTTAEVDVQVARAVAYEKTPVVGDAGAFYKKATGIASNEGTPKDWERMDMVKGDLMGWRFTEFDRIYDQNSGNANKTQVKNAVNAGRSVICYMGHGSKTAWVTSGFSGSDAMALNNSGGAWPMIWDVACVNGDFVRGSDCFAEGWAKAGTAADPRGAIGIVAASTNMAWHPPVDWQRNAIKHYFVTEKCFTGGALNHYALVKATEQWGSDTNSDGVMMIEQCIYFGDSSVLMRSDLAVAPTLTRITDEESGAAWLEVSIGEKKIRGARVVLKCDEKVIGITGTDGRISIPEGMLHRSDVKVTVTGPNLVPALGVALP